jgi:hypothetical protein
LVQILADVDYSTVIPVTIQSISTIAVDDVMIPLAAKLSITLLSEVTKTTLTKLFVRFMMPINPPVCGREAMVVTHKFSALEPWRTSLQHFLQRAMTIHALNVTTVLHHFASNLRSSSAIASRIPEALKLAN